MRGGPIADLEHSAPIPARRVVILVLVRQLAEPLTSLATAGC